MSGEAKSVAELRQEFHECYGNGDDFEGIDLINFLTAAGRFITDIVGADAANRGMAEIARALDVDCKVDEDWASALDDALGDAYCWPLGVVFYELNAYAYYGFILNGGQTEEERAELLKQRIDIAVSFMSKVPLKAWNLSLGDVGRTYTLALGRWALDNGDGIEPSALAIFGGISERRVRNMMAGRHSVFRSVDGKIPAKDALDWLKSRPKFRPSVWRMQETFSDLAKRPPSELETVFFVPVARDGSIFHPGLVRDGKFSIGAEGQEKELDSYSDALNALQKLSEPIWRRPSPLGSWTRVTAVRWERISDLDLERYAAKFEQCRLGVEQ